MSKAINNIANMTIDQLKECIDTINSIRNNPKIKLKSDEIRWYEDDIKQISKLITAKNKGKL